MRSPTILVGSLLATTAISCTPPSQKSTPPVDHRACFARAATSAEQVDCLKGIVALGQAEAAKLLAELDAPHPLLAVDDESNCVLHDNQDGTTYRVLRGGPTGSSKIGAGMQLAEVRWLGWASGKEFKFSHQRYSIFAGKSVEMDQYAIFFVVHENSKLSGLNAGELTDDHHQALRRLKMWPQNWPRE